MLNREKVIEHAINNMPEDESSALHRFLQDFLILIEFGNFDIDEENESQ